MGLTSHRHVERIEAPGGIEQEGRRVAAARAGERDLRPQPLQPRAETRRAERARRSPPSRAPRPLPPRRTSPARQPGAPAPLRGIGCQLRRARQERRGRGGAPTGPGPVGRALQLGGHRLVNTHRRVARCHALRSGSVSGSVVSASARCASRRSEGAPPGRPRIAPVDAGSGHGLRSRRAARRPPGRGASVDADRLSRAPDERRVTQRLGHGQQQQPLRRLSSSPARWWYCSSRWRGRSVAGRSSKPPASSAAPATCGRPSRAALVAAVSATMRSRTRSSIHRDGAHEQGARILLRQPA